MESVLPFKIPELNSMRRYPGKLYYRGSLSLLERPKISIVGARRASQYTRTATYELAKKLSLGGMAVVSGAAGGVDRMAHEGAGAEKTVAVLPCGIDLSYPAANAGLIAAIGSKGLTLSPFDPGFGAREWSFVVRNEIVVALGSVLVITEAEIGSGSMRSAEYALKMGKPIYVLPHRLHESDGTRRLVAEGKATLIEDIDTFVSAICGTGSDAVSPETPFGRFCRNAPTYEEAMKRFPAEVFEAELSGMIEVRNGRVYLV